MRRGTVEGASHDHDRSISPHFSVGSPWAITTIGGRGVRAGPSLHPRTLRGEVLSRTPRGIPPPWWGLRTPAPQQERPCDLPPVMGGIPQHLSRTVTWATQRYGCLSPGTRGMARLGSCSSTTCYRSETVRMYGPLGPWGYAPGERGAPAGVLRGRDHSPHRDLGDAADASRRAQGRAAPHRHAWPIGACATLLCPSPCATPGHC